MLITFNYTLLISVHANDFWHLIDLDLTWSKLKTALRAGSWPNCGLDARPCLRVFREVDLAPKNSSFSESTAGCKIRHRTLNTRTFQVLYLILFSPAAKLLLILHVAVLSSHWHKEKMRICDSEPCYTSHLMMLRDWFYCFTVPVSIFFSIKYSVLGCLEKLCKERCHYYKYYYCRCYY